MKNTPILMLFILSSCFFAPTQHFTKNSELDLRANPPINFEVKSSEQEVRMAIFDSGVDYLHPELHNNIRFNLTTDGIGLDVLGKDTYPMPIVLNPEDGKELEDILGSNSHGTHVASLAALGGKLNLPGAKEKQEIKSLLKIIPIRVLPLDAEGIKEISEKYSLLDQMGDEYKKEIELLMGVKLVNSLVEAIHFSIAEKAHIANLSLGIESNKFHPEVMQEINQLVHNRLATIIRTEAQNILFVFAAGNESQEVVDGNYPASLNFENTITVGALKDNKTIAKFSNYGNKVDIYIDGDHISGLLPQGARGHMSGTSMSTPLVANLAAKMKLLAPCLSAKDLKNAILKNADEKILNVDENEKFMQIKVASFKRSIQWAESYHCE